MTHLSTWRFEVHDEGPDGVTTYIAVVDHVTGFEAYHATPGPLHEAVIEAYEEAGIICPLVVDDGLLRLKDSEEPS